MRWDEMRPLRTDECGESDWTWDSINFIHFCRFPLSISSLWCEMVAEPVIGILLSLLTTGHCFRRRQSYWRLVRMFWYSTRWKEQLNNVTQSAHVVPNSIYSKDERCRTRKQKWRFISMRRIQFNRNPRWIPSTIIVAQWIRICRSCL